MQQHSDTMNLDIDLRDSALSCVAPSDVEFARRSVRYLLDQHCSASEVVEALTSELGLSAEAAHDLLSETTALVAA